MSPRLLPLCLLAACAVAAICGATERAAVAGAPGPAPSPVVFPVQRVPLRFDHARHLTKARLTCAYCHTQATTSRRAEDRLLPPPERCDACHGTDHRREGKVAAGVGKAADCAFCHEGYRASDTGRVARVALPAPHLKFDHAVHHDRGIRCAECHANVERAGLATRDDLPTMQSCLRCHTASGAGAGRAPGACDVCHLTRRGAVLETDFPEGSLLPPLWLHDAEHGPDWLERHKRVAAADSAFCATCHEESECTDCHDGRVRPRRIHPSDWLDLHAVSARQNGPSCTSCHRAQSFCITCHQRAGVTLSGPIGAQGDRGRFHPPKAVWTDVPRGAGHHSFEAQRNIQACASCHTERDCALCHATAARGGLGGLSPHPPGFRTGCGSAFSKNPRPCLYCHSPSAPELARCR